MVTSQLPLAALFLVAAAPEPVLLTPDTIAEHGYHLQCVVVDQAESKDAQLARPSGPALVRLRFRPLSAKSFKDLETIKAVSLVVREGDAVLLNMPLRAEPDPSNWVSLFVRFSTQKDLLRKMQLVFDDDGQHGRRTFVTDLKAFIEEK